jgi:outer membrane murein-binding lipoprotein Lpp
VTPLDATLLPSLGITAALVIVIGYLLVANHRDRTTYQTAMRQRDSEHAAELVAARTAHDADLNGLRTRLTTLEKRLAELETELDHERDLRRIAQDEAAAARRRL